MHWTVEEATACILLTVTAVIASGVWLAEHTAQQAYTGCDAMLLCMRYGGSAVHMQYSGYSNNALHATEKAQTSAVHAWSFSPSAQLCLLC